MAVNEDWISLREFARRRGVNLSAVQKAIDSGRVTAVRRADVHDAASRITGIDFVLASEQWNRNTDPVEAAKSGKVLGQPADQLDLQPPAGKATGEAGDASSATKKGGDRDPDGYYQERAKREKFAAAQAELEYLEAIGSLIDAAEARKVSARRYRALRDQVLNVPDRIAAILAAEKEPARIHALLTAELKRVLHELSDDAAAEAARGTEERVAA
jgi:hypothetical protein